MAVEATGPRSGRTGRATRRRGRAGVLVAGAAALALLASCSHLGYYTRSIVGGAKVLSKRRPVAAVIADPATDEALRGQLELALRMRDFAVSDLGLPDNGSYRKYSDVGDSYVVWNVVAAPELSVAPKTWCFLIVGCVAYRGYFSEQRAERFAEDLRHRGYDVDVGGVEAYSTAGWFADPILSTFIDLPEPYLAGLLFHELAHQRVLVKGDTAFSESFAMAVEEEGAMRWLAARGLQDEIEAYRELKRRERRFSELVLGYRDRLERLYAADESDEWKRRRKAETLDALRHDYEALKGDWQGYAGFDGWFSRDLNNARLALLGVYHQWVPAFQELLRSQGGRLEAFSEGVEALAALPPESRERALGELLAAAEVPEGP
jgi:predicted aminopeptidase